MIFDIIEHGAKADGSSNDAAALQAAIDACSAAGGGTVLIPAGRTVVAGSFELRSNINLHIEGGAVLRGATAESDYPLFAFTTGAEAGKRLWIGCQHAENVSITGTGEIDGNSMAFVTEKTKEGYKTLRWRPAMTCFEDVRKLRIRDVTLRNSANWALHFSGCEDIVVDAVTILNDLRFPNCDGIDPDHCRNVRISNCYIEAGDDCIVFKNTEPFAQYGPCENITVSNCTLVSTSSAVKIGSESVDDFRNIIIRGCVITGSNRGLCIQLRDGGNVENILFSDCIIQTRLFGGMWWGAAEPVYITAYPRHEGGRAGSIRRVVFSNIRAEGENGFFVMGASPEHVSDILFERISLCIRKVTRHAGGRYDPRPCPAGFVPHGGVAVGEATPWGQSVQRKNAAVYVENASNVVLRDFEVSWPEGKYEDFCAALECRNAPGFSRERFAPGRIDGAPAVIIGD